MRTPMDGRCVGDVTIGGASEKEHTAATAIERSSVITEGARDRAKRAAERRRKSARAVGCASHLAFSVFVSAATVSHAQSPRFWGNSKFSFVPFQSRSAFPHWYLATPNITQLVGCRTVQAAAAAATTATSAASLDVNHALGLELGQEGADPLHGARARLCAATPTWRRGSPGTSAPARSGICHTGGRCDVCVCASADAGCARRAMRECPCVRSAQLQAGSRARAPQSAVAGATVECRTFRPLDLAISEDNILFT